MYLSNSNPKVNAMQAKLQEQLSPADAEVILGRLPERRLSRFSCMTIWLNAHRSPAIAVWITATFGEIH
ncbi:hypothetical protein [Microcoleus sp. PH2017_20_SFW_D_A]|uniref:hypothetical protein n=1 Tax=Microcoleus sp. PH2017_20_SFW_D_A TaxID=2798831 RepID=UPI0025EA992F|nr:hypothetical protein [Microcoleus sp. PH2017_20_SFW_D_A]